MKKILFLVFALSLSLMIHAQRSSITLEKGWRFVKGEQANASDPLFDDSKWETVVVPHVLLWLSVAHSMSDISRATPSL